MPINRRYPLGRLKEELKSFPLGKGGVIFIEYVLLAGVNDGRGHADQLVGYLEGVSARVNVIAYNRGASAMYSAPPPEQVHRLQWLADQKFLCDCASHAAGYSGRLRAAWGLIACGSAGPRHETGD